MTYGEAVSRINNGLNSVRKDMRIPKRYILSVLKEVGSFLLSQKIRDKTLYKEVDLFKRFPCVELIPDDIVRCPIVEFRRCGSLMRSRNKLPKIVGSRYGYAILLVSTIDGSKVFQQKTIQSFRQDSHRKNNDKFKGGNYYILDGYLYIPDSEVEVVEILALTLDEDSDKLSSCGEYDECRSLWDTKFPSFPDRISDVIVKEAIKEVSTRLSVPVDENSNLDVNQKVQTIQ